MYQYIPFVKSIPLLQFLSITTEDITVTSNHFFLNFIFIVKHWSLQYKPKRL